MSPEISENTCLLALLLEPAEGTLEGLAFFDPDAGHPIYRLLTTVRGEIQLPTQGGQHSPNAKEDTPDGALCQIDGNLFEINTLRTFERMAIAAVSVVNRLGP